jgi:hypothetical protein
MLLKPLLCPEALWKVAQSLPLRASCLKLPFAPPPTKSISGVVWGHALGESRLRDTLVAL